jgi:hypothetical protein
MQESHRIIIQGVPKNDPLFDCESTVPRYQICLEHDGHQCEHRGTREH